MSDDNILTSLRYFSGITKLYLLHSPNDERFPFEDFTKDLKKRLESVKFGDVELYKIDAFEMQSVIDAILAIAEREEDQEIFVNVTGGTNLMAAAASIAAYSLGAKGYYVLDEGKLIPDQKTPIVELPMPTVRFTKDLQGMQLDVLKRIAQIGTTTSVDLREDLGISAQRLSYHIGKLREKGLIVTKKGLVSGKRKIHDSRYLTLEITNAGKLVANISLV